MRGSSTSLILRAGAYLGEVIRRQAPPGKQLHWLDYDQAAAVDKIMKSFGRQAGTSAMLWNGDKGLVFPLGKIAKYLENGSEDSTLFFAEAILAAL